MSLLDRPATDPNCGGCQGLGAHRRWCPAVVGLPASIWGRMGEQLEDLGDRIGSNEFAASNHCYAAAGLMKAKAKEAAEHFAG